MTILIDNGHGGLINGVYQTAGKRSPVWDDGAQLFEGEFNRAIVNQIIQELTKLKINYVNIAPEYWDVRLETRVNRANKYSPTESFYLSVHSNAGGGRGSEIFTSPGDTKSDQIATIFGNEFIEKFPERTLRTDFSDGDLDKERRFYVLTRTRMPAILTENFFMDNEEECRTLLMSREGRAQIAHYHVEAIKKVKHQLY